MNMNDFCCYEFICKYFDSDSVESKTYHGIVYADNIGDACKKIYNELSYGIYDLHIADTDCHNIYIFEDTNGSDGNLFEVMVKENERS